MGNNEARFLIYVADKASQSCAQGRKQVQSLKNDGGIFTATVTGKEGTLHTLTVRNADGTMGDTYPNVPTTNGEEYEVGTAVQFTFNKISPFPKIISGVSNNNQVAAGNFFVTGLNFFSQ